jgi:L-lactate dehydrogenase complex protein LldG
VLGGIKLTRPTKSNLCASILPDVHLCWVRAEQVVGGVPDGIAGLAAIASHHVHLMPIGRERCRTQPRRGVHGPRTLHIFLVETVSSSALEHKSVAPG